MKTENSKVTQMTMGPWEINCHPQKLILQNEEISFLKENANSWSSAFPKERKNLALEKYNVPSVLIRFDYATTDSGKHVIYEVEDRPMGMAQLVLINPLAGENIQKVFGLLKNNLGMDISIFVAPSRIDNSDDMLLQTSKYPLFDNFFSDQNKIGPNDALIVRSLRDENEYWGLEQKSLATISMEGWKGYGLKMGLWKEVTPEIDFSVPFVLKPEYGCRGENVYFFHPEKQPGGGFSTKTKIKDVIDKQLVQYIQDYHAPERPSFLNNDYYMIKRVFMVFNPVSFEFECVGGIWMARNSIKVHGSSDAISGAIIV